MIVPVESAPPAHIVINAVEAAGTYLAVMAALAFVLYQAPRLASALTGGPAVQCGLALAAGYIGGSRAFSQSSIRASAQNTAGGSMSRIPTPYTAGQAAGGAVRQAATHAYQRIANRGRP